MDRRSFILGTGAALGAASAVHAAESGAGASAGDIVIGQSAVLSGTLGPTVQVVQGGARLVFDEVNAQGGLWDRKLRLVALDDAFDPARAQANYLALVQQHNALACICGVGAGPTLAAIPVLRDSATPLVGATAVVDSVRDKTDGLAFYTRASQQREAATLVQHLGTLGIQRIGVSYIGTPGGMEVLAQVQAEASKRGISVTHAVPVAPDAKDVVDAGKAMAKDPPQAVILYLTAMPAATYVQTVWAQGGAPAFYGMSILAGDEAARALGAQSRGIAISQVTPYPWDAANTDALHYRQAAEKARVPLGYHSYEGYIAARVLVEGLRQAGRDATRAKLRATLARLKTRVATLDIDFTPNRHTGSEFVELVQARSDGRFVR